MRPFRFGVTSSVADRGDAYLDRARRAETLGYAVLLVTDHLTRQLSPIPALAGAAAVTTSLRIGSYVFANDFRHPLLLAREAATVDVLSGGRLEFGLGAGWRVSDYTQLGVPYDPPGQRIDRMQEALGIIQRLFAGETVTHVGAAYRVHGARLSPAPVQAPIPVMLGGGGPRLLGIAAERADIISFIPQFSPSGRPIIRQATESALADKVATVRAAAGERFDRIELSVFLGAAGMVGSGTSVPASVVAGGMATAAGLADSPYVLAGTRARLRDVLERRRERLGISYYVIPGPAMEAMAPLVEDLAGR
ncbi:MAG TPA: TIGR03621 family F420-dependent LLM class oxidoreductase [Candidatus Limnocylindria bacterium]|jgi:probable F420-dependent oxidoreductase